MSLFSSIPVWGWLDITFTLMVLIGICGESDWAAKFMAPEKIDDLLPPVSKRKFLKKCSEWLVILGIAGEVFCLIISLNESAQLNNEAGLARKDASDARLLSDEIETTNAQLVATNLLLANQILTLAQQIQETAKVANETRSFVNESNTTARLNETKTALAEATRVTTDVQSIIANSNLASVKITSADRMITPKQEEDLVSILKPFTQMNFMAVKTVSINTIMGDSEALQYAYQLKDVLNKGGFESSVGQGMYSFSDGKIPKGLEIVIHGLRATPSAIAISQAFSFAKINFIGNINVKDVPSSTTDINVWRKP